MKTAHVVGVEGRPLTITARIATGLPRFTITGMKEATARETRVRVMSALTHLIGDLPTAVEVTIAIEDGSMLGVVDGTGLDLPIALAVLGALSPNLVPDDLGAYGELSLGGEVRPARGLLCALEAMRAAGATTTLVAPIGIDNSAVAVTPMVVRCPRNLADALAYLHGKETAPRDSGHAIGGDHWSECDLKDIRGTAAMNAKRALEIAAAGRHSLLLVGSPGAGKTMLARRLPGILPPPQPDEALAIARIHTAAGLDWSTRRPFRAPHHSTTAPGLVGGGTAPCRPGEITLAHEGVLFLDEIQEFSRAAIDPLREVIRAREVVMSRATGTVRMPANAMIIASSSASVARAMSMGLVFDMAVSMPPSRLTDVDTAPGEPSAYVRERVSAAREHAAKRPADHVIKVDMESAILIKRAQEIAAILVERVLSVARTIADLARSEEVEAKHVAEALQFEPGLALRFSELSK